MSSTSIVSRHGRRTPSFVPESYLVRLDKQWVWTSSPFLVFIEPTNGPPRHVETAFVDARLEEIGRHAAHLGLVSVGR
jgi:hypothetical protein